MKKFFVMFLFTVSLSGCNLMVDPNAIPYNRVDVFNNSVTQHGHKTYFTLSDRGGNKLEHIFTGDCGWVPQNIYFASNGYDQVDNNVITIRFYDAETNEYLGLCQYQVSMGSQPYQAIHVYYEPKSSQYGDYSFVVR